MWNANYCIECGKYKAHVAYAGSWLCPKCQGEQIMSVRSRVVEIDPYEKRYFIEYMVKTMRTIGIKDGDFAKLIGYSQEHVSNVGNENVGASEVFKTKVYEKLGELECRDRSHRKNKTGI